MINQFIYPLRVHIEDTDYGGVVYHSNYLNFFERARSEWCDQLGLGIDWQREHQIYLPVHQALIDFIKPARLHEMVEVVSKIKAIRPASLLFEQYLRLAGSPDKMLCKAEIKLACVTYDMQPRALPESSILATIRRALT